MINNATPYIILNGKAQQALEFYGKALGAKTESLQRFGEVDESCSEAQRDNVMHAVMKVGGAMIMMSDGPGEGALPPSGSVQIALDMNDVGEAHRCFDALGASGKVVSPLFAAPWGALFGVVVDEFGVSWMFNCATTPAKAS